MQIGMPVVDAPQNETKRRSVLSFFRNQLLFPRRGPLLAGVRLRHSPPASFIAASRSPHCSMAATRSSTVPPAPQEKQ